MRRFAPPDDVFTPRDKPRRQRLQHFGQPYIEISPHRMIVAYVDDAPRVRLRLDGRDHRRCTVLDVDQVEPLVGVAG